MGLKNKVQLITYPDSMGGNLKSLNYCLEKNFPGCFEGGIHILPPFPSSGDRGFAPITYLEIEPRFGDWEDMKALGENYEIMVDIMINHISQRSVYFQDFLKKGADSEFSDMFFTLDKIWDDGIPVKEDVEKIFLRRKSPFSTYTQPDGTGVKVWTTFGKEDPSEQIDLDIKSPKTKEILEEIFQKFSENKISQVRLDAIGYIIKKKGTNCFFVEPEIHEFLDSYREMARNLNIEILPEIHANRDIQFALANRDFWIYDFVLPYTVLQTIFLKNSEMLKAYLKDRPSNQFTMLDCHDGLPILPDLAGLVDVKDAEAVTKTCIERGANISRILSEDGKGENGFDVHQINGTFYSLVGENDDAYLAARAIQLFAPGIPQIYYVGLLAGSNKSEYVEQKGDGRAINRHNYSLKEIETESKREVVQRLMKLIKFRNEHPAFDGKFYVNESEANMLNLMWENGSSYCSLKIDLNTYKSIIEHTEKAGESFNYEI